MNSQLQKTLSVIMLLSGFFLLPACSTDNSSPSIGSPPVFNPPPPAMASFDVTVSNLTNAQPMSPIAVIAHQSGYAVFSIGSAASMSLEEMAEGGDNTALLAAADANMVVATSVTGAAAIGPAGSEMVTIDVLESSLPDMEISIATMLVNTNDAFTSLNAVVGNMAVGDVLTFYAVAYDAGTEADTEMAADIPGPAGGGTGFDMARDDQADRVAMHSGIVSQDDGLATSDLTEQHRFDNPVAHIRIARTD